MRSTCLGPWPFFETSKRTEGWPSFAASLRIFGARTLGAEFLLRELHQKCEDWASKGGTDNGEQSDNAMEVDGAPALGPGPSAATPGGLPAV